MWFQYWLRLFPSYLGKLFLATIERSKSKEESRNDVSTKNQGKVKYATRYSTLKFAVWRYVICFSPSHPKTPVKNFQCFVGPRKANCHYKRCKKWSCYACEGRYRQKPRVNINGRAYNDSLKISRIMVFFDFKMVLF